MNAKDDLRLNVKRFNELTNKEVYEILKVRSEIFVIEQKILYLDMDNIDYKSYHMYYNDDERIVAYLRAFADGEKNVMRIGRVLTLKHGEGIGKRFLVESIEYLKKEMPIKRIDIDA